MSDPRAQHPDSDQLLAFAEGELTERLEIERHLDVCGSCAEAVLIAREVATAADERLVPDLMPVERDREKDRLRTLLSVGPLRLAPNRPGQKPIAQPFNPAVLGMLGAGFGLEFGSGAKPLVAGAEHPAHPAHKPDQKNSDDSSVRKEDDPASSHQTGGKSNETDPVAQFLEHVADVLGTGPTALPHPESGPHAEGPEVDERPSDADWKSEQGHETHGGDEAHPSDHAADPASHDGDHPDHGASHGGDHHNHH